MTAPVRIGRVKIYREETGARVRYRLRWYTPKPLDPFTRRRGQRFRVTEMHRAIAGSLSAAKELARATNELLDQGPQAVLVHPQDRDRWSRFLAAVAPIGKPTDVLGFELAEAHRLAPGVPLTDLAKFWNAHRARHVLQARPLVDVIPALIAAKQRSKLISERHRRDLRDRLLYLAKSFQEPISEITAAQIQAWLDGLAVSNRTRNNYLGAIQNLWNWASRENLVSAETTAAVQHIEQANLPLRTIHLWTPAEMSALLESARCSPRAADRAIVPYLAIAAFAFVRPEEIKRLTWSDVDWDDAAIYVSARKGKTKRSRRAPLLDNLRTWLEPYRPARDAAAPICAIGDVQRICRRIAREAGLAWRPNALRKSGVNYRLRIVADAKRVSVEAGNSPQVLEAEYLSLGTVKKKEAESWFALVPSSGSNVIQLRMAL